MSQRLKIDAAFLLGAPLLIGLILGANQTRLGAHLPWGLSVLYWIAITLMTWSALAATTRLADLALRPWGPPRPLVWLCGVLVGSLVARQLIYWVAAMLAPYASGVVVREMPPIAATREFALYYLSSWAAVIGIWLAASWARETLLARTVEATAPPTVSPAPSAAPAPSNGEAGGPVAAAPPPEPVPVGIMRRIPASLGRPIVAVCAEDHYLRVHTPHGDGLVLGALSEAVEDFEASGMEGARVHRSWWVAKGAVRTLETRGRRCFAHVGAGIEVPVSQTYREAARLRGVI
jgi:hypothetical protein